MSESAISRRSRGMDIALHTSTSVATTLDMRDVAGAIVSFGTMSTSVATLAVYGSHAKTETFRQLCGTDGVAVTITLAPSTTVGKMYPLPDEAFAVQYVKLVGSDESGNGVPGVVMLKS